ncbi:FtsK/SpoIIIE domain-containing protein [Streptacidiphilus melanogenes]|uniref:FtsK/SpoIIIE domain-containing protein n=1 Tax=Streptacidiphilus melanogenes TaxID=411235 RepID=UPI0009FD9117|nr:FtsK/SpoIIIE domain-containing protein [Streptacidiphilus melanogenes]
MTPAVAPSPSPSPTGTPLPSLDPSNLVPSWLPLLGVAVALVLLVWLTVKTVTYIRADTETRASIRQAFRIRRTWPRLARNLGLTTTDRTPTLAQQLRTSPERPKPEPRILFPKVTTTADRFGVQIRMRTIAKVGLAEVQREADHLAEAWGCTRVSVDVDKPGQLLLRAVRNEPLHTPIHYTPTGKPTKDLGVWDLGVDEYAQAVALRMANVPGAAVAGLPGYGKSSLINALIARLAPSAAVQFIVLDGKVSRADEGDYADVIDRIAEFVGDDLDAANQLFKRLVQLRRDRSSAIRRVLGTTNMWDKGPTPAWPLLVVIVDEAHTYFRDYKGNDPETKRLAALSAENARLVEDLVKKGRSVGITTLLATQKATGDAIPTFIRDVCSVALSFAQKTTDAAVAALGEDIRNWPDASPINLLDDRFVGVAVMVRQGKPGFLRVRIPYINPDRCAQVAQNCGHLTADPFQLLTKLTGPRLVTDALDDAA